MKKYNTEQRKEILNILKDKEEMLSAKEIQILLNKNNSNVGLTTIYRYLNTLENENKLKKHIENNEAKYLFLKDDKTEKIYIKCENCGKLIYFDCNEMNIVKKHLMNHHNVTWDFTKSSLIGKCVDCK